MAALEHTAAFTPLAFALFEEVIGSRFPYKAFQQVRNQTGATVNCSSSSVKSKKVPSVRWPELMRTQAGA